MSKSQAITVSSIVAVQIQRNMREEKFIAYDSDRSKYIVCPRSQSSTHKYDPCSIIKELFEAGAEKAGLLDGLSLEVIVASPAHKARDCQWVATALPYDNQPQKSQKQIDEILNKIRPNCEPEIEQPKLPAVKPSDLTLKCVSKMPNKTTESKSSSWKLKGFFLRPETAKRLRAYVNRQQEADQKIDASDIVDHLLSTYLSDEEKEVSIQSQIDRVKSKRASNWTLRSWLVQPAVANKLKAHVNRRQESGEDIDASDIVNQALSAYLNNEAESVAVKQVETDPVEAFYEERLASALATREQLARGEENHELASLIAGMARNLKISKRELICMMLNDCIYTNKGFWALGEKS